ncbi:helix-turn-helix domain-containing protein [Pseudomonas vancouverensis]|uniref:XRE family transcriptional regulator n=1 Tax=Pseudomonas vancouverensis TaxID=95300 RepID=A0A1H2MDJ1_PSEVA|nr:helix-turn-helix transcriptional regulator [Pseudomonas vancouverensis]KAB0499100.1 helix-turn-helix transcriptional regulator [Pseudomonas vancouverensis]TDB57796.1 XRE family transcriptional regulator [Pseudomonas vancouverensis]SDU91008.1 Transcriptional regulator, contains XRE-family HTH domain [Pseudomonas vancouverensis]
MSLSNGFAAVLKAVRAVRGLSQQDLGDVSDRKHFWQIENAKSSPTLNKLEKLSKALQFDPVTLLTLSLAVRDEVSPSEVLQRVQKELADFERMGGLKELVDSMQSGVPKSRASEQLRKLAAVRLCKREGLTQKATTEKLGLPKSTVHDLWKMTDPDEES